MIISASDDILEGDIQIFSNIYYLVCELMMELNLKEKKTITKAKIYNSTWETFQYIDIFQSGIKVMSWHIPSFWYVYDKEYNDNFYFHNSDDDLKRIYLGNEHFRELKDLESAVVYGKYRDFIPEDEKLKSKTDKAIDIYKLLKAEENMDEKIL